MKLHLPALVLALCTSLLCCSDPPTSDPGTFWYRYNTAAYLEAGRTFYAISSGLTSRDRAWAAFHTPDSLGANAGTVTFEGLPLLMQDSIFLIQGGGYLPGRIYSSYSGLTPIPLQLGGRLNTFAATGGPTVPAMTVTAPSPVREIVVTSPLDEDTLSSDGFTIRWENSTQEGTLIELRVWSLVPGTPVESEFHEPLVADNGSYRVDGTLLGSMPPGPIGISVRRFIRTTGALADERRYDARIYTQRIVAAELE
jgi:hypothetical protein